MIHLWPDEISENAGPTGQSQVSAGFSLEIPGEDRYSLWYRLPAEHRLAITEVCDPYLVAAVHHAMARRMDLHVHGPVSASLLGNLDEFMIVWSSWLPKRYAHVEVIAESQTESAPPGNTAREGVAMFSGGVNSSYSAWRYREEPRGRFRYNLRVGVMLHGFDIQLPHEETFTRAFARAQRALESIGLQAIPMATNLRSLGEFKYGHGAMLISCLMLLQKRFAAGLIGSSYRYAEYLHGVHGSNMLTDEMLSSDRFRVINDGSGLCRFQKIRELAEWQGGGGQQTAGSTAFKHLRVCLGPQADQRDVNCCRCPKCVCTILAFRALGLGLPACFEQDITNGQILGLKMRSMDQVHLFRTIQDYARDTGVSAPWTRALGVAILLNRVKLMANLGGHLDW